MATTTMNRPKSMTEDGNVKEEGQLTTMIEEQTSKVPSGAYLAIALGSMALSATLLMRNNKDIANFVGQWVPTLLIMGLYNKVVKLEHEIMGE
jgi:hypothetical protein